MQQPTRKPPTRRRRRKLVETGAPTITPAVLSAWADAIQAAGTARYK